MQELLLKLMNDLQILKGIQLKHAEQEEPAAQSFLLNWNFPMADDDEYTIIYKEPKAITPDLPAEEPDNSLGKLWVNTHELVHMGNFVGNKQDPCSGI
ncbi:hypothetical protein Tco_0998848 [Tanacetum coccineum]